MSAGAVRFSTTGARSHKHTYTRTCTDAYLKGSWGEGEKKSQLICLETTKKKSISLHNGPRAARRLRACTLSFISIQCYQKSRWQQSSCCVSGLVGCTHCLHPGLSLYTGKTSSFWHLLGHLLNFGDAVRNGDTLFTKADN